MPESNKETGHELSAAHFALARRMADRSKLQRPSVRTVTGMDLRTFFHMKKRLQKQVQITSQTFDRQRGNSKNAGAINTSCSCCEQ